MSSNHIYRSIYSGACEAVVELQKTSFKKTQKAIKWGCNVEFIRTIIPSQKKCPTNPDYDCKHDILFVTACAYNNTKVARWILNTYSCVNPYYRESKALTDACLNGHLNVVRWLCQLLNPWQYFRLCNMNIAFYQACRNGHFDVVEWIVQTYYPRHINIRFNEDFSFNIACENGHLRVVKFIFGLYPRKYHRRLYKNALYRACRYGHIRLLEWVERANVINIQKACNKKYTLSWVCEEGHLQVVQWIVKKCPNLVYASTVNNAFFSACATGQLAVAKWLIRHIPYICNAKIRCDISPFYEACTNGHLHVAKWFKQNYPRRIPMCYKLYEKAFITTCEEGYLHVAKWLYKTFRNFYKQINRELLESVYNSNELKNI